MKPTRPSLRTCGASALAGALFLSAGTQAARAGAFALSDQSASAIGTSFSNMANPQDPGTLFFNPAGMTYLDGVQTESSGAYISPRAEFDNKGSRYTFGQPISGSDGGSAPRSEAITQSYLTATVFNHEKYGRLALGIGATVPFGEVVDYDPHWVGRYSSQTSVLRTIDYGFSAAYRWKFLSVGAGFDAQYSSAVLTQAIDLGLLGFARGIPGFLPGRSDAVVRLEGSDVSYGFNVGGLVEYLQPGQVKGLGSGKIGVSYRSGITQNYTGRVTFRGVQGNQPNSIFRRGAGGLIGAGNNTFDGQDGNAELKLPEIYNFAISQDIADKFTVMGDLTWTRWSRLQNIPINFENPLSQTAFVTDTALNRPGINNSFEDAFRYSGAIAYRPIKGLEIRLGGGYDESPVPNQSVRNTRIPDGDRWLLSAGLKYHAFGFNSPFLPAHVDTDIEVSYLHEFVNDPAINSTDAAQHTLIGKYNEQINIVSAALVFRYGPKEARLLQKEGKDYKDRSK